ncbi:MAG: uroporphyrinogen-III C-methyltransferase [Gammaproteobacteria bacterium]
MSEPDNPPRAAAHGANPLAWLLALALLAGAAYAGWRGWLWTSETLNVVSTQQELLARLGREVQALRAQADELGSRQTDLAQAVQRNGVDVASLVGQVEDSNEALARLNETVEGGRTRVQLAAIEQLLLMANDRLQLAHDANSALRALDLADQRLSRLNDPRLLPVREALSQERAALAAMALPDTTGFALALGDIQKRAATLPLRVHVSRPGEPSAPAAQAPAPAAEGGAWSRVVANVKAALAGLFSLRRDDAAGARLLHPDEAALVGQILELKLEGARLALLARDGLAFRELAGASRDWLERHYDPTDTDVQLASRKLAELHGQALAPAPPDISRSLALLRAQLGAIAR